MPKTKFYAYNPETGRDKRIKRQKTAPIGVSDNPTNFQFMNYNPSTGRSKKIRESGVTKTRTPRDPNAPKKPRGPRKYGPNNRPSQSPGGKVLYTYTEDGVRSSRPNPDYLTPKQSKRAKKQIVRDTNSLTKRKMYARARINKPARKITRAHEAPF